LIVRDRIHSNAGDQFANRGQKGLGRAIEVARLELMARSDRFAAGGVPSSSGSATTCGCQAGAAN
jgi:hypothetical protein